MIGINVTEHACEKKIHIFKYTESKNLLGEPNIEWKVCWGQEADLEVTEVFGLGHSL